MLLPKLDLNFWNSYPKINFRVNLGRKSKKYPFYLKIGTHGISTMLVFIPTLVFWILNLKSIFGQFGPKNSELSVLPKTLEAEYLEDANSYSEIPNLNPFFGQISIEKFELSTFPGSWHTEYLEDVIASIPRKIWKQSEWLIVLSPGCSYIFIIAKVKNGSNQRKNVGSMRS